MLWERSELYFYFSICFISTTPTAPFSFPPKRVRACFKNELQRVRTAIFSPGLPQGNKNLNPTPQQMGRSSASSPNKQTKALRRTSAEPPGSYELEWRELIVEKANRVSRASSMLAARQLASSLAHKTDGHL